MSHLRASATHATASQASSTRTLEIQVAQMNKQSRELQNVVTQMRQGSASGEASASHAPPSTSASPVITPTPPSAPLIGISATQVDQLSMGLSEEDIYRIIAALRRD